MDVYRIKPSENGWGLYENDQAEPLVEASALHEVMEQAERVIGERRMSVQIRYRHGAPEEFRLHAEASQSLGARAGTAGDSLPGAAPWR
ncbi:hypothetical protein [Pseudomonas typographi]|uniref:DUF2188 domain-containing protein n=1 Tax=Pseudomonas typographi TaxID=2715964 RepID=A0ABR7Z8U3_9PSED|nr:hypothetical protein [Pseudomonas typographi]MBD1553899.1 hypothetical protein [Pseudomonas typographi]MBD1589699.1 hypothetical protein [Pseudomonas typographi]MBD1601734.1 hypothetical protein [Pseudomonas typographi]